MNKTRQFDDIKNGELIRFLVEPSSSPYEKEGKAHWDFGIVVCDYMKNFSLLPLQGNGVLFTLSISARTAWINPGKGPNRLPSASRRKKRKIMLLFSCF